MKQVMRIRAGSRARPRHGTSLAMPGRGRPNGRRTGRAGERQLIRLLKGCAIALGALLACGGASAQTVSKDPIKFSVGIDAAYSQAFVAQHDKLFAKHGVTVEVRQFTQGGDGLDALMA